MLKWQDVLTAWITIDGKILDEYEVKTSEDTKRVTCWVASELGKNFSIHWNNASFPQHTGGCIKVDGNDCGGRIIYRYSLPKAMEMNGVSDGATIRLFKFSSLSFTEEEDFHSAVPHRDLGLIELTIVPVEVLEEVEVPLEDRKSTFPEVRVHERSKTGLTQQITLEESQVPMQAQPDVLCVPSGLPLVTFAFKYRPIDMLRAEGIAPRPPHPTMEPRLRSQTQSTGYPGSDDDEDAQEERRLREKLTALDLKDKKALKQHRKGEIKPEPQSAAANDSIQSVKLEEQ